MNIEYDPNLVEQAVHLASRRDAQLESELHKATDALYELADTTQRESRFLEVYGEFFRRLELDSVLPRLLGERPLIEKCVERCIVRASLSARKEAAELFVKHDNGSSARIARSLFVSACPESLLNPDSFERRMRRELMHVADMLDDRFGYDKDSLSGNQPRQNLIRDRYRVLWEIHVEGRIARAGQRDDDRKRLLGRQLEKVFARYSACIFPSSFERVYQADELTHRQLLDWATSPELLFEGDGAAPRAAGPGPAEPCPVCSFSTYDWLAPRLISPEVAATVREKFPQWQPANGICRQCAEIYASCVHADRRHQAHNIPSIS